MKIVYEHLPTTIQNLLITIKNTQVYHNKYGIIPLIRPIKKVQEDVIANERVVVHENMDNIRNFLQYCSRNAPFYKSQLATYDIPALEESDFQKIPILRKEVLKANLRGVYSKKIRKWNSIKFLTSGTTGSPMAGYIWNKDLRARFRVILKTMCESGFDLSAPYARFLGKEVAPKGKVYRRDMWNNHFLFSIARISQQNITMYYEALTENKIEFLEGYPSTINNLVDLLRRNNYALPDVRGVFVTAEKLLDYQRNNIESFFGCGVFDYYGSTEQSVYIYKPTGSKGYIVSNVTGYLEVIKDDGSYAEKGEEGRMVITSLTSHFTPLVRYEIGDRCLVKNFAVLDDGTRHYEISEIIGREEESFKTRDGRVVSRFSLLLKFLPKRILAAQLFLSERSTVIELRYKSEGVVENNDFAPFQGKMEKYVGIGYDYVYTRVSKLESTPSGKVRTVFVEK